MNGNLKRGITCVIEDCKRTLVDDEKAG